MCGRQVFHAGTATNEAGEVTSVGGRVLAVTAMGADVAEAQAKAYQVRACLLPEQKVTPCMLRLAGDLSMSVHAQAVDAIDWPEGFCRRDIGWRALSKE